MLDILKFWCTFLLFISFCNPTIECQIHSTVRTIFIKNDTKPIQSIVTYRSVQNSVGLVRCYPGLDTSVMYVSSIETYNDFDQLESLLFFNKKKEILEQSNFFYNEDDQLVKIDHSGGFTTTRQYLENKIILKTIKEDKVKRISIQLNDDRNRIIDWVFLNYAKDTIQRYQYQYDDFGNKNFFKMETFEDDYCLKTCLLYTSPSPRDS